MGVVMPSRSPIAKRKTGRPSRFTPAVAATVCQRLAGGESLRKICADPAFPALRTVLAWALGHTEDAKAAGFPQQYARARELRSELYADECVDIADTEPDPQRARVRVDTRKWVASKLLPKTYGDRVAVDHGGTVKWSFENPGEAPSPDAWAEEAAGGD